MTYEEALNFISQKSSLGIKPGLSRIEKVMSDFGNVQNQMHIIHIAGTNGKGTVSSIIAGQLVKSGYKVGLFSSPWVTDYREQIMLNGKMIDKKPFANYVDKIKDYDLTEFEMVTAIMYLYFYDNNVDFAVVECGMGGENDSTNIVKNTDVAVITSVSVDHTAFLGNTVEKIAKEKSGIIKKGSFVAIYPSLSTKYIFANKARDLGCTLVEADEQQDFIKNDLSLANCVLNHLNATTATISDVPSLPARCQMINSNVMIDGAHNPDGAKALVTRLPKNKNITAVIAMMKDKDTERYLKTVAPFCKKIIATTVPSNNRSMSAECLKNIAEKYCSYVVFEDDPHIAVKKAMASYDYLLVCGSFYLAREIINDM